MSLIDTSAWIEYLRQTGSRTNFEVRRMLNNDAQICDVIRMEILAGARDQQHVAQLEKLLARATTIKTEAIPIMVKYIVNNVISVKLPI